MNLKLPSQLRGKQVTETVLELKALHEGLSSIEQDHFESHQSTLDPISRGIVKDEFVKHSDAAIRLLASCCLANILRLYAPNAPYTSTQLKDIFTLMIQQIKGLEKENNAYQQYAFYLVESLATVKSIILLLEVDDGLGERERLLHQIFGICFDLSSATHLPRTMRLYLLEMLQTLLDESDGISMDIVRFILNKCGDSRAATQEFALELVRLCADRLQPYFGMLFHETTMSFTSDEPKTSAGKRLEGLKLLHEQIVTMGKVVPQAVASVMAQMEEELRVEESDLRALAIVHIAKFFMPALNTDLTAEYSHLWNSWMGKMNDKSVPLRVLWIKYAISLLFNEPPRVASELRRAVSDKLQDIDAKVREKTIEYLSKAVTDGSPSVLGEGILEELINRCRDKVNEVRLTALNLVCLCLKKLVPSNPGAPLSLFTILANGVFKLIYVNDHDLRVLYQYFIEHSIFLPEPGRKVVERQAEIYVNIFHVLDEGGKKAFRKWLHDKALFIKYFQAYLKLSLVNPRGDTKVATIIEHMVSLFRADPYVRPFLNALPSALIETKESERNAWIALTSHDTSDINAMFRTEQMVDQWRFPKSPGFPYSHLSSFISRRASFLSVSGNLLQEILKFADIQNPVSECAQSLVEEFISEFPLLGTNHSSLLEDLILHAEDNLDHLCAYAKFITAVGDRVRPGEEVINYLVSLLQRGSRQQAKYSIRILMNLNSSILDGIPGEEQLLAEIKKYLTDDSYDSEPMNKKVRAWQVMSELATLKPEIIAAPSLLEGLFELSASLFGSETQLPTTKANKMKIDFYSMTEQCQVLALRFVRNTIISLRSIDKDEEIKYLRTMAPKLVEWLPAVSPRVKYAIAKVLIHLVPRPTMPTLVKNLSGILDLLAKSDSPMISQGLQNQLFRQYLLGNVGLIYLSLPMVACEFGNYKEAITLREALISSKKSDRWADPNLPISDMHLEVSSRSVKHYEELIFLTLILAALYYKPSATESLRTKFTALAELLAEIYTNQNNISLLFDGAVQLKLVSFIPEYASHNKSLYILSELLQNCLRAKSNSAKWPLQSTKQTIRIVDEILVDLAGSDETNRGAMRNVHKSYLSKLTEKIAIKSTKMSVDCNMDIISGPISTDSKRASLGASEGSMVNMSDFVAELSSDAEVRGEMPESNMMLVNNNATQVSALDDGSGVEPKAKNAPTEMRESHEMEEVKDVTCTLIVESSEPKQETEAGAKRPTLRRSARLSGK